MNSIAQVVALRIRTERLAAKLSQGKLARLTGIQRPIISRLESGKHTPSLLTLERVASALGVPLATLVDRRFDAPLGPMEEPAANSRSDIGAANLLT